MIANFHINYGTKSGEQIVVHLISGNTEEMIICQSYDAVNWHAAVQIDEKESYTYKYVVQSFVELVAEQGEFRQFIAPKGQAQVFFQDAWRAEYEPTRTFFSAAFKDVIFKREETTLSASPSDRMILNHPITLNQNCLVLQLFASAIKQDKCFAVIGNTPALGEWQRPIIMSDVHFPLWQAKIPIQGNHINIEYKYVIYNPISKEIEEWEIGTNRTCVFTFPSVKNHAIVRTDESFRYRKSLWRGAGLAIPVFSLRSEQGLGIGEYTDLKLLVDWAVKTYLKLVQVLPVNDTVATKTWQDCYPYAAISVYALHPYYVNLEAVAKIKDKQAAKQLTDLRTQLNALDVVDIEQVGQHKFAFFKILYEQEKKTFWKSKDAQEFIEKNAYWLKPYAAFCHLRDKNGTVQFNKWAAFSKYSEDVVADLCTPQYMAFDEVALYYFIQYHAHKQLLEATNYARLKGVVLKGDLPIGIYRYSCDAWVAPHLYNMDGQAGAPPDAYAVAGQNWGFPTYNWDEMAKDGFAWWRDRMAQLSTYFDALRIDHILGFFRIWEIPTEQIEGTLGLFNPRLPYSRQELDAMGLRGNLDRFTYPYIRTHFFNEVFGDAAEEAYNLFFDIASPYNQDELKLKDFVNTQSKIKKLFAEHDDFKHKKHFEKPLMGLVAEVLLIEEPLSKNSAYSPRITVHTTRSYKELDDFGKYIIDRLYDDYFFKRHDTFWQQQALWKLPALIRATNMLICGEDLGMIPNSVPGVMRDLNILALEIQRMPKGKTQFGEPKNYDYMTVCSPSCHDMSTIRGWWESNYDMANAFYHQRVHHGNAPHECTPEIVQSINWEHLESPSMWAIFPIQDLVGMDKDLRRADAKAEQINEPSNPNHYWRFRFHLTLERLLTEDALNKKIGTMVRSAGR